CGIPLVIGNWSDAEGLFRTGTDHLVARNAAEMSAHMQMLLSDGEARRELALRGRQSILARHTCAHRVDELLGILESSALDSSPGSRPNVSLGAFL
ncbi:MAG: glycosyl transferase, partial [Labilithrix sp.]|nr:glycosyl transferase [Labilithrix sp.]